MMLLRTGPEGVAAMEGLIACDRPLRVGGSVFSIRRHTHVRAQVRRQPEGDGQAMLFRRTADEVRDWPRRRVAQNAVTVARVAADGHGRALPCPERAQLVPHFEGAIWSEAGVGARCHRVVHPFLQAEVEIWITTDTGIDPTDEAPRPMSMQDAVGGLSQIRRRINGERSRTEVNARHHDNGCIRQTWQAPLEAGHAVCMAVAAGGHIAMAGPGENCTVTILRPA